MYNNPIRNTKTHESMLVINFYETYNISKLDKLKIIPIIICLFTRWISENCKMEVYPFDYDDIDF